MDSSSYEFRKSKMIARNSIKMIRRESIAMLDGGVIGKLDASRVASVKHRIFLNEETTAARGKLNSHEAGKEIAKNARRISILMEVKEKVDSQYRKFDKAMTKRLEKFAPTKA